MISRHRFPGGLLEFLSSRLRRNSDVLMAAEDKIEHLVSRGHLEDAARWAWAAAAFASMNHPGRFMSVRLEAALLQIAKLSLRRESTPPTARARSVQCLHVLTDAGGTGGHVNFAQRFIQKDAGRVHSVVLTGADSPSACDSGLVHAAQASGGSVYAIGDGGILARASRLRELAARFSLVFLENHSWDVVPAIAFGCPEGRPRVIKVNLADHCFWVGSCGSDVVAACRPVAENHQMSRRGVPPGRSVRLPVPVPPPAPRRVKVAETSVPLLTAGWAFKYVGSVDISFLDLVLPTLRERPEVVLTAVGPSQTGVWREACASLPNVKALGPQPSLVPFHSKPGVFLDPYPMTSPTAALESAARGFALLSYAPFDGHARLMSLDDLAYPSHSPLWAATPDEFRIRLGRLIDDVEFRQALQEELSERVVSLHSGRFWRELLEEACSRALAAEPEIWIQASAPQDPAWEAMLEDVDFLLVSWLRATSSVRRLSWQLLHFTKAQWSDWQVPSTRIRARLGRELYRWFAFLPEGILEELERELLFSP